MINVIISIVILIYNIRDFLHVSENTFKVFKIEKKLLSIFNFKFEVEFVSFKKIRLLNMI